jgi:ABC-type transport system involved in multi-copper enzyme maturation permease subunit
MIPAIKAEYRKILTVRSTYIILGLVFLIVLFYAGFITGFRIVQTTPGGLLNHQYLTSQITGAVGVMTVLGSIVALLLFGHEYRFNTIMYTLTASNSRSKVLASKIVVITIFAVLFALFVSVLSPLVTILGIHLHHYHLVSQSINYGAIWWKCLLYVWGDAMFAMILIALIRNQIGAIVAFLLIPTTVESLLTLLLKNNSKYLPFTSLSSLLNGDNRHASGALTNAHTEAFVVLAYVVVGWAITWVLFIRRDAN